MSRFIFTQQAEQDMDGLTEYIDSLPPEPGARLGQDLQQALNFIDGHPQLGQLDPELSHMAQRTIRRRVCRDYLIFYVTEDRQAKIIGVLHGKRDVYEIIAARIAKS